MPKRKRIIEQTPFEALMNCAAAYKDRAASIKELEPELASLQSRLNLLNSERDFYLDKIKELIGKIITDRQIEIAGEWLDLNDLTVESVHADRVNKAIEEQ